MNSIDVTLKRIWDDLRTVGDQVGECIGHGPHPKVVENLADGLDDVAGRLYKLAERIRGQV